MTITIAIHYISNGNRSLQRGDFKFNGRKPEQVAFEFWNWIQRNLPYGGELEKVIVGEEDITEMVKELEAPLY